MNETPAESTRQADFLAAVAHELRTPLNALIGMSRLLLGTPLNREQEEYAQTMLLAADAMLGLTNNILDYGKVAAGCVALEEIDFDLTEVVEDAIDLVAVKVWEKGLKLTYGIELRVPRGLRGDPTRLRQVLVNLLGNAVKFTERGAVHVAVDAASAPGGKVELRFAVSDSGIGIEPEGLKRLFGAFAQADPSIARRFGGSGLGLAICERLVALMSGRISAESEFGRGSVFRFTALVGTGLPMLRARPPLMGKRVLIADADPAHRALQEWRCNSFGMMAVAAPSAQAALDRLGKGGIDVVLLDDEITATSGPPLREIRRCAGSAGVPVVLAARGSQGSAAVAGEAFAARILKPMRTCALARTLEHALQGAEAPAPAGRAGAAAGALRRWRVLVADDNATNRKLMMTMLRKLDIVPDVAEDGLEALEALRGKRYDLVFMDMQMPQMDGIEATRQIVKRLGVVRPRIVAVTANRKLMMTMLRKLDIVPDVAEDGLEALEALRGKRYDLVFMDMQMPQMDGIEATRQIVKRLGVVRPRIVAVTANASDKDRERCLEAGMDDYLSKPIMPEVLKRVVEDSIAWARGQRAAHGWPEDPYLDKEVIETLGEIFRHEPAKLGELMKEFLSESAARVDVIAVAAESGDLSKIISAAHRLKGGAAGVGAKELARVAFRLKCAAFDGNRGEVDSLASELAGVLAATREALRSMTADGDDDER